jgi:hypothetical protein
MAGSRNKRRQEKRPFLGNGRQTRSHVTKQVGRVKRHHCLRAATKQQASEGTANREELACYSDLLSM